MARDRLAGMRNGPSGVGYTQADYQPVAGAGYHEDTSYGYGGYGYAPADESKYESRISLSAPGESTYELTSLKTDQTRSFWDEVTEVQNALSAMENAIARVARAQDASLANLEDDSQRMAQQDVNAASSEARALSNATKTKIQVLATKASRLPQGRDRQTQESQVTALRTKFKSHVQRYTELESGYSNKLRARAERQFRVIKPDATPEEVEAAVEGSGGVFTQALMNSNRHGEAANALLQVQDRHAAIRKIEETMTELAQLFNDVDVLLSEQDEQVDAVASNAQDTYRHMDTGVQHTTGAVESSRKARKKRKICFWIIVVLIIIIIVAVIGAVCGSGACASHSNNDNNKNQRRSFADPPALIAVARDGSHDSPGFAQRWTALQQDYARARIARSFGDPSV